MRERYGVLLCNERLDMKKLDWVILVFLILSPIIINYLILGTSIGGHINGSIDGWLGFYGALVGSLITMFVLYRTRRWNEDDNSETRAMQNKVLQYESKRVWLEGFRKQLDYNYRILDFQDTVFALNAIVSGDCEKALSYLLELNKNIEMQAYSFDLYFPTNKLSEEELEYSDCYNRVLKMYGTYVNDLIIICRLRQGVQSGIDINECINKYVTQLQSLSELSCDFELSQFLLSLGEMVKANCKFKELEDACVERIGDTSVIHSAKGALASATKALLKSEEKRIEEILQ